MNLFGKTLYYTGLTWACICLTLLMSWPFLPFEFSNSSSRTNFFGVLLFTMPFAILFTLVKNDLQSASSFNLKIVLKITAAIICPLILGIAFMFGSFGEHVIDEVIFKNNYSPSKHIVIRHYDIGAYDNGEKVMEVVCISQITSKINYVSKIDTLSFNKSEWARVRDN